MSGSWLSEHPAHAGLQGDFGARGSSVCAAPPSPRGGTSGKASADSQAGTGRRLRPPARYGPHPTTDRRAVTLRMPHISSASVRDAPLLRRSSRYAFTVSSPHLGTHAAIALKDLVAQISRIGAQSPLVHAEVGAERAPPPGQDLELTPPAQRTSIRSYRKHVAICNTSVGECAPRPPSRPVWTFRLPHSTTA